jgi:hypothetical protein
MEGRLKRGKQFVHFVAIFHLLKHGRPVIDFEHMKGLLDFLDEKSKKLVNMEGCVI